jgi:hypothetical protein
MDDLLFGWIFWTLSVWNQLFSTIIAFCISVPFQQWLIRKGIAEEPGRIASWLLNGLALKRRNVEVEKREEKIRAKSVKLVGAVLVSPLIGGVLPILILNKHGVDRKTLLRLSIITTVIYAAEFAALHGGYGFGSALNHLIRG